MPAGAVYVGRPTVWGNPFRVTRSSTYHGLPGSWFLLDDLGAVYHPDQDNQRSARLKAVDLYLELLAGGAARFTVDQARRELAGHDLVCWCPSGEPCHADALLRLARGAQVFPGAGAATRPEPELGRPCSRCGVRMIVPGEETPSAPGEGLALGQAQRAVCPECGSDPTDIAT